MRLSVPDHVLRAFGQHGSAVPLSGGQGTSWRAGDIVLKPVPVQGQETWSWLHHRLAPSLPRETALRIALPVAGSDGSLLVDGWGANRWMPGSGAGLSLRRRAEAARAFHRATGAAPADLPTRQDPWARADRQAWGQEDLPPEAPGALAELLDQLPVTEQPLQIVHGDLAGNIIDHPVHGLGVLDLSLYRRPVAWAEAVLALDVMGWETGHGGAAVQVGASAEMLGRALAFRLCAELNLGARRLSSPLMDLIPVVRRLADLRGR